MNPAGAAFGIIAILLFVTIHELGHFLAAKALGIKATEFFVGFGPRIWSTRRGETEYGLKAIPLGGYVRIVGMNPLEEVADADLGRTYREQPFWKKSIVVLAGVAMNFVLAFLIFAGLLMANGINQLSTTLEQVVPTLDDGSATPAAEAGIEAGDTIVSIDGVATDDWTEVGAQLAPNPGQEVVVEVERNGDLLSFPVTLATRSDPATGATSGFLGVAPSVVHRQVGFFDAIGLAGGQLGSSIAITFQVLGTIVQPETLRELGGVLMGDTDIPPEIRPVSPIGVGNIGSQVEDFGWAGFVFLLASVNVMLGTLNVLPLYPLDGGHFAVALYEKVSRRAVNVRVLIPVAAIVIALVSFLGLVAIILDVVDPINI